jgi:hypothetical protein
MDDKLFCVDEKELPLLSSLLEGPKYLDMGRTPIPAIELAWRWADAGLVTISNDRVQLTEAGREILGRIDNYEKQIK